MMRMMSFAVGLPQLVWVAVYGAAAFFLFYYGRKLDLSLPLLNVSLYRALIQIYIWGCLSMVLTMAVIRITNLSAILDWEWSVQQAFLFLVYELRVVCVLLFKRPVAMHRVIFVGTGLYLVACLLLLVEPYGRWISISGGLLLQVELLVHLLRLFGDRSGKVEREEVPVVIPEEHPITLRFRPEDFDEQSIPGRLLRLFRDEKIYLRPNLTLDEVAFELGTNKTYLSKCINIELQVNFREFVNAFRIQEAIQLYESDPGMTLMELCQQCGFKNQASFTFSFKLNTGQTPGEWCRDVKQRKDYENKQH